MKQSNRKGQSTLEYIILVTAIIAVAIVFLRPQQGGRLYDTVNHSYGQVAGGINTLTTNLTSSW
ncbi:MAG TPA: class III signal peptide-containing protein [Candidatus Omnitrophota bacterium]|nr:class III signal peptide-containing protein [Candidatus Omnitrophota bacterium]